jgi:2-C-methyl-D-erythritol 4-phosphate cytidylyltransferase
MREAFREAPEARRILVSSKNDSPPLAGEGRVGVYTLPMSDTVKEVMDGRVLRTVPRETLVQVTGPWVFEREALADALTRVPGTETEIVDMIGLCEAARIRVRALPAQ